MYKLVSDIDLADFEKKVSSLLKDGWNIYGDPQVTYNPTWQCNEYHQAMVRR